MTWLKDNVHLVALAAGLVGFSISRGRSAMVVMIASFVVGGILIGVCYPLIEDSQARRLISRFRAHVGGHVDVMGVGRISTGHGGRDWSELGVAGSEEDVVYWWSPQQDELVELGQFATMQEERAIRMGLFSTSVFTIADAASSRVSRMTLKKMQHPPSPQKKV